MTVKYSGQALSVRAKNGTTGPYNFYATITQNSQDVQANTSNVTVKLEMESVSSGLKWNANSASNQPKGKIAGTLNKTGSGIKTYTGPARIALVDYTATVPHNADGTKTVSEVFSWIAGGLEYYPDSFTIATATDIALDTIPRAGSITAENALIMNDAGTLEYTVTSAASFYYRLEASLGGHVETLLNGVLITSTYNGTIGYDELLEWLNEATSGTLTLTLYTYSDSEMASLIGTNEATATIVNGNVSEDQSSGTPIPRLFPADAEEFNTNGITVLADTISCEVVEERNGQFELQMVVATTTPYFEEIEVGRLIVAKPNHTQKPQAFEIYEISKPINQKVSIKAHHISYKASFIPIAPFTATGITNSVVGLNANSLEANPFFISTDITNEVSVYKQTEPMSLRARLGGSKGSLLDTFGGEYMWDNYSILLLKSRGYDRGVKLRLGKNITDLKQNINLENVITGVLPMWKNTEDDTVVYGDIQHSEYAENYAYARSVILDFSTDFEEQPTVAQLNEKAATYVQQSKLAIPANNIKVKLIDLADTEEYKDSPFERVNLCDTVEVIYEALNISYKAKVVKVTYDVLTDRTVEVEIGEPRSSLAQTIKGLTSDSSVSGSSGGSGDGTAYLLKSWPQERPSDADTTPTYDGSLYHFLATDSMASNKPAGDGHIINMQWDDSSEDIPGTELWVSNDGDTHNALAVRGSNAGSWRPWSYADTRRLLWEGTMQGGDSISLDCSKYSFLKVWVHCYAIVFPVIVDLTKAPKYTRASATGNTALRGSAIGPVVTTSNAIRNYVAVIELNAAKNTVYARNLGYFSGSSWTAQASNADYYVYKIEGYL